MRRGKLPVKRRKYTRYGYVRIWGNFAKSYRGDRVSTIDYILTAWVY